jgi:ParB family transcriptional regulator, chromosome partitioning protein
MAKEAERLLSHTGWLPEPLRLPDVETAAPHANAGDDDTGNLPAFLANDDTAPAEAESVAAA